MPISSLRTPLVALAAAAAASFTTTTSSTVQAFSLIAENSFAPPFNTYDSDGMRTVPHWEFGGNGLDLNENFLRLTPDRASRRGHVWNTAKLDKDEWSATIRFRVSGQGKRMFGDGLAVFFTTQNGYKEGALHGFADVFTGFGVIFDTYVNSAPGHVHKDILVVTSDGSGSKAAPHGGTNDPNPAGCDGDDSEFRYWEQRDDFSVLNHSAARIAFRDNKVTVYIDARGNGKWSTCVADVPVAAPAGWYRQGAYLGVIATTGDLADNHDLLSVQVGLEDEVAPNPYDISRGILGRNGEEIGPVSTGDPHMDTVLNNIVARSSNTLTDRMAYIHREYICVYMFVCLCVYYRSPTSYIHERGLYNNCLYLARLIQLMLYAFFNPHPQTSFPLLKSFFSNSIFIIADHMEHQLASVNDGIRVALRRLGDAEESNKRRIEELERRLDVKVEDAVEGTLSERLARLEVQMNAKLTNDVLPQLQESVSSSSRGWIIPFIILGVILLIGFGVGLRNIRWLVKRQTGVDFGLGYSPQKKY
jgi:hypothetical protein